MTTHQTSVALHDIELALVVGVIDGILDRSVSGKFYLIGTERFIRSLITASK